MKGALYSTVSTAEQPTAAQFGELRSYCERRHDSGSKNHRQLCLVLIGACTALDNDPASKLPK
jgi:hypothetical protein